MKVVLKYGMLIKWECSTCVLCDVTGGTSLILIEYSFVAYAKRAQRQSQCYLSNLSNTHLE